MEFSCVARIILFTTVVIQTVVLYSETCSTYVSNSRYRGYFCDNGDVIKSTIGKEHQFCVFECIRSPECAAMNYNTANSTCSLLAEPCVTTTHNDDFNFLLFRDDPDQECTTWSSYNSGDPLPDRVVIAPNPISRFVRSGNTLVGHMSIYYKTAYSVLQTGVVLEHSSWELLVIDNQCSTAWVPYTVGEPLPPKVVVGGYMANIGGTYPVRIWGVLSNRYCQGYYALTMSEAICRYGSTETSADMEILVIL